MADVNVNIKKELEVIFTAEAIAECKNATKLAKKHAKELRKKISKDSPRSDKTYTGRAQHYADTWYAKTDKETDYYFRVVVANKNYRLPHLLERGHRIVVLKKTAPLTYRLVDTGKKTRDFPHIIANGEREIEKFYQDVANGTEKKAK